MADPTDKADPRESLVNGKSSEDEITPSEEDDSEIGKLIGRGLKIPPPEVTDQC